MREEELAVNMQCLGNDSESPKQFKYQGLLAFHLMSKLTVILSARVQRSNRASPIVLAVAQ